MIELCVLNGKEAFDLVAARKRDTHSSFRIGPAENDVLVLKWVTVDPSAQQAQQVVQVDIATIDTKLGTVSYKDSNGVWVTPSDQFSVGARADSYLGSFREK